MRLYLISAWSFFFISVVSTVGLFDFNLSDFWRFSFGFVAILAAFVSVIFFLLDFTSKVFRDRNVRCYPKLPEQDL